MAVFCNSFNYSVSHVNYVVVLPYEIESFHCSPILEFGTRADLDHKQSFIIWFRKVALSFYCRNKSQEQLN